jgi:hypothetical protein
MNINEPWKKPGRIEIISVLPVLRGHWLRRRPEISRIGCERPIPRTEPERRLADQDVDRDELTGAVAQDLGRISHQGLERR